MKNTLIASSIALMTIGTNAAFADIAISGDARMGVVHTESSANVDNETQFDSRVRFTVAGTGSTDAGLSFGAAMRIDQSGQGGTANNDSTVYVGNDAFTVTFGDVDSAIKTAVGDVAGVGYTGIGSNNEVGYLGVDNTAVSIAVGAGPVGVYVSAGQRQANSDNNTMGVGAQFAVAGVSLAAGYAEDGAVSQTALGVGVDVAGIGISAVYLDNDAHATVDAEYAASASYSINGVTLTGFYREVENLVTANNTYTGIGASYDLGGGATLAGGIVDQDGTNRMDLGLKLAF
jgi:outer membrane protein OmpU